MELYEFDFVIRKEDMANSKDETELEGNIYDSFHLQVTVKYGIIIGTIRLVRV